MQKVLRYCAGVVVLGFAANFPVQAAEWVQASQISDNFREVDKSSIRGARPQLTFTSRHVINDANELKIGRQVVKYLVMEQRVDCAKRTTVVLSSEAQRADMRLISRQKLAGQEETPVLTGSVDEDVLNSSAQTLRASNPPAKASLISHPEKKSCRGAINEKLSWALPGCFILRSDEESAMARLIKMVKAEPIQISVGDQTKYICGCGLSASKPYCDGSHELAAFEDEGKLYWYDSDGNCHEVADTFPKIRGE